MEGKGKKKRKRTEEKLNIPTFGFSLDLFEHPHSLIRLLKKVKKKKKKKKKKNCLGL
jgi:hypothetical protein